MKTQKLTVEISENLFGQLEYLSTLTEESIEDIAIQILAGSVPRRIEKERKFNEIVDRITLETLHQKVDFR